MNQPDVILTGIKPTVGPLIGNYAGAGSRRESAGVDMEIARQAVGRSRWRFWCKRLMPLDGDRLP